MNLSKYILSPFLLFMMSSAHAWVPTPCGGGATPWANGNLTMRLRVDTLPNTAPQQDWIDAIQRAVFEINNLTDTNINLVILPSGATTVQLGNSISEMGFVDFPNVLNISNGFIGLARSRVPGCMRVESDIWFNSNVNWDLDRLSDNRSNPGFNLGLVASHELGHALGFSHSNGFLSRMNTRYPDGGPVGNDNVETPLIDDIRGYRVLYPATTAVTNDLVASRYKNFYGEVAQLNQVKRVDTNAQTTTLTRGSSYFIDYTVENHGNTSANNVRLGFYLSEDSEITSDDFFVASMNLNMAYGSTASSTMWFTMPQNAPAGARWLGYVIDDQNDFAEQDEVNNGVPVPGLLNTFWVN